MTYTSIFEKFECLLNLIASSIVYPIFISIFIILLGLLFWKKKQRKKIVMLIGISYLVLFLVIIFNNYDSICVLFDSIATNFFTNIYFPSAYVYFFILLTIDVVTIISMFNFKLDNIYKIVNGICFFSVQFLLVLIMDIVCNNDIDIFDKTSLFTNTDLVILLELSVNIFIIWVLALLVVYITNKLVERIMIRKTAKELVSEPINMSNELVMEEETLVNDYLDTTTSNDIKEQEEVDAISTVNVIDTPVVEPISEEFTLSDLIIPKDNLSYDEVEDVDINKDNSNKVFDMLLNNKLPLIRDDEVIEESKEELVRDNYTLNDYKVFNKILKDIRENNNSNIISIDRELELKLIMKYSTEEYDLFKGMLKNYSN